MLTRLIASLLGQKTAWRLGRGLYMQARGDVANNIRSNGELMVQRSVLGGWRTRAAAAERLVVFDVGANVGDWSACLRDEIRDPRERSLLLLHLFEPVPHTFERLRGRLANSGAGIDLRFNPLALSSAEGAEKMYVRGFDGSNSIHPDTNEGETQSIDISRVTATRFCADHGIGRIHLLKCDTEGHDMEVVAGALPLLRTGAIRVLQFEYNYRWIFSRHYLKDVFDAVEGLPYRIGRIHPDHVDLYSCWHPEMERFFEANYLIVHDSALPWFQTREVVPDRYNTLAQGPE
ncbi:MAG TPA: FkbM family methyltransferase [Candidatus Deferrimicrobiaceae bacterium]|jgi:FkbM family methyltransferase